ncbi:alpha/beta fold hydrolase [Mycolicibacterium palauense]|uniref:alpha/beta fold hydrolase n=1 Tax=Mycolicibacterium palauense TaxID=2034511 RepID=UPI000BFEDA3F|nr:alpha/beta hydrolase [Mycolicibacterium palauense]
MLTLIDHTTGHVTVDDVVLDVIRRGHGRPVFLLHGAEGIQANGGFIEELATSFDVIAPSHPGFDLSPRPEWCDSVGDLAFHYLRWIHALGLEHVLLIGLQFGGWVAAEMATRACGRIDQLVLVDPLGIKVGGRDERDIADVFATSHERLDELVYHRPEFRDYVAARGCQDSALRLARNEEALVHYGWQPYMHDPKLRRKLGSVSLPSLVVWGAHDGIVDIDYGRAYAESLGAARFEVIEDAGHRPQIEAAEQVAGLITQFAADVRGASKRAS